MQALALRRPTMEMSSGTGSWLHWRMTEMDTGAMSSMVVTCRRAGRAGRARMCVDNRGKEQQIGSRLGIMASSWHAAGRAEGVSLGRAGGPPHVVQERAKEARADPALEATRARLGELCWVHDMCTVAHRWARPAAPPKSGFNACQCWGTAAPKQLKAAKLWLKRHAAQLHHALAQPAPGILT